MGRKLLFQEWLVKLGYDPSRGPVAFQENLPPNQKIIKAVREAVGRLSEKEQAVIRLLYYDCIAYKRVAEQTGFRVKAVKAIHDRAIIKLRKYLADFVKSEFGITVMRGYECPICKSPHRDKINQMFYEKRPEETWSRFYRVLKSDYNIIIKTPQILIGHYKYHLKHRERDHGIDQ